MIITIKDYYWWFLINLSKLDIKRYNLFDKNLELIWDKIEKIDNMKYYMDINIKVNWYSTEKKEIKLVKEIRGKIWMPKVNFYYLWSVYLSLLAEKFKLDIKLEWNENNKINEFSFIWGEKWFFLRKHQLKILESLEKTRQIDETLNYFFELFSDSLFFDKNKIRLLLEKYFPDFKNNLYCWFIISPPRSWKTITMLELARRLKSRALIIVDLSIIFNQFKENIPKFFDLDITKEVKFYQWWKSFKKWNINDVKLWIAMIDSLYQLTTEKNEEKLRIIKEELSKYDVVLVDEAHSAATQKFIKVFNSLNFKKIFWFTATKQRKDWNIQLLERYIWRTIVRITNKEVDALVLPIKIRPYFYITKKNYWFLKIIKWREVLDFNWWLKNLFEDEERNKKIRDIILQAIKKNRLIIWIWWYVKHLYKIADLVNSAVNDKIAYVIEGRTSTKERKKILEMFNQAWIDRKNWKPFKPKVLLATFSLLWKWFDWPFFDTLILMRPMSWWKDWEFDSRANITQAINRIWNNVEGKKEPICVDIVDIEPSRVLLNMALWRLYNVYYDKFKDLNHNFVVCKDWEKIKNFTS
jgi:hypothetical protein